MLAATITSINKEVPRADVYSPVEAADKARADHMTARQFKPGAPAYIGAIRSLPTSVVRVTWLLKLSKINSAFSDANSG